MDYAVLKKIAEYSEVYEGAALGISSVEEMKAALKKKGATGGTFQRRTEYLTGQPAYLSINGIKYAPVTGSKLHKYWVVRVRTAFKNRPYKIVKMNFGKLRCRTTLKP